MSKLLFLGDLFYDYEDDQDDIKKIAEFIHKNGYRCILNLEGSMFESSERTKKRGPNLAHSAKCIDVLKSLNVVAVALSNNHMMDFGKEGLKRTLETLDANGILHCGAGMNLEESLKPVVLNENGKRIYIYSYGWDVEETFYATKKSCGCAPRIDKYILTDSSESDLRINIMHWGFEYNTYPMPLDIELAHRMVDTGTGLVIGSHPHVMQAKETYQGGGGQKIYYSLGNFYFGSRRENFLKRVFGGNIHDKSNYSLGVVYDTETKDVEKEIIFYYDSLEKKSKIIDCTDETVSEILPDITSINYKSKEYCRKIKDTKLNINPILTGNKIKDTLKIKCLYAKYFVWKAMGVFIRRIPKGFKTSLKKLLGK